jgi:hypothetical protein
MSNVLRLGRKVLTSVVTLSLVLSLAPTLAVHAFTVPAECPSDLTMGTQVKTPQYAAMYVVDGNGKLRYFDDGSEYKTWQYNYTLVLVEGVDAVAKRVAELVVVSDNEFLTVIIVVNL